MAGSILRSDSARSTSKQAHGARRARTDTNSATAPRSAARRGFSLLELLVVLAVAWLLISMLMPGFARVREAARRVVCASNMHQIAIALESYSRDSRNRLPNSYFAGDKYRIPTPQDMMILNRGVRRDTWDGIGRLFSGNYMINPGVFYCPSHTGNHSIDRYEYLWTRNSHALIYGNYQYRGMLNLQSQRADPIDRYDRDRLRNDHPGGVSILADGLRTKSDFNHVRGCNLLEDDLSVKWFSDEGSRIYDILPDNTWEDWPRQQIWLRLDAGLNGE